MTSEQWYWDMRRKIAVRADERGPWEDMLGPYPSKHDAEHWRERVEERNEEWDSDDEDWERGETDEDK